MAMAKFIDNGTILVTHGCTVTEADTLLVVSVSEGMTSTEFQAFANGLQQQINELRAGNETTSSLAEAGHP